MSQDLYAAWAGASAAWRQLEVVSGNVANANTPGYREQRVRFESTLETAGRVRAGAGGHGTTDGALVPDGVPTHLALRGDGFFALADGTFTRDGAFRLDEAGTLVTTSGVPVLGESGPVRLAPGETLAVAGDGAVSGSVSGDLGKLRLVRLLGGAPVGGNRWTAAGTDDADATVVQGAREGSNVDPMRCLVDLVQASRAFEAQQKVMQASDEARARLNRMQE
ncbi:MAG: flagellar hook-basal body protein [Myxococcota bacterium]